MSLAAEKLQAAILALARSGPIKQRLIGAYLESLIDLSCDELPSALREEFTDLCDTLNRVPPLGNEGRAVATVRKMSNIEADECAQRIVRLFGELAYLGERSEADAPMENQRVSRRYMRRVG